MDFLKNNIFKLLSIGASTVIYFAFIYSINNKIVNNLFLILIVIGIIALILELNEVKIKLSMDIILNLMTKAIYFILGSIFLVLVLYLVSLFAGRLSIILNGTYGIDQKTWLGFMGTCLASLVGVYGAYFGSTVREKYKK